MSRLSDRVRELGAAQLASGRAQLAAGPAAVANLDAAGRAQADAAAARVWRRRLRLPMGLLAAAELTLGLIARDTWLVLAGVGLATLWFTTASQAQAAMEAEAQRITATGPTRP